MLTTTEQLHTIVEQSRKSGEIAIDTETDGLATVIANLCGVSISTAPRTGVYIPVRSPQPQTHLDALLALNELRPILEDDSIQKVGHNLKFDINVFRRAGVKVAGLTFDTMVASYIVDSTRSSHKLDNLSLALLRHRCMPIGEVIGYGKVQKTFDQAPLEIAGPYAAEDADISYRLKQILQSQLAELGLTELFRDVEMPLVEVLAEMEWNGIIVDPAELDRQSVVLGKRIDELRRKIIDSSPFPFNPDSPKQLAVALFNKPDADPPGLGLKVVKKNKTGPSTDVEVLEKLAADPDVTSPVPELIVEYRQLTKLVSTYLVALKEAINPVTGRVHTSFNQTVAATGRLASSDPNLQNIPIRSEVGRDISARSSPRRGNLLISADYSQIELRILGTFPDDTALIEALHEGDRHSHRRGRRSLRRFNRRRHPRAAIDAKMVNFGIVYGVTAYGLARRLGPDTSVQCADEIIQGYKKRFAGIDRFLNECVHAAQTQGYVETILKRRRPVPQVESRNPQERALGERIAINTVVQGSAADLIKLAMIDLFRQLPEKFPRVKMLLQIHDELVFEAPNAEAEAARAFIVERMSKAMALKVPLLVESAAAANWGGMK